MPARPPTDAVPRPGALPPRAIVDEAVLVAESLQKTYVMGEVEVHALRGVSLSVRRGELIAILGPSGSGKSTLLNILGGLDTPSTGRVHFGDLDLGAASDRDLTRYRRAHVGFVFQLYNLLPSLTALENVALVTDIAPSPMPPEEALALVGLTDRIHHFPSQLSGGEQQRVAIARAIAKRPELLLCDEPTGALDITSGVLVLEAIDRVTRTLGATTLLITHNAAIARMADRVVRMRDGAVSEVTTNAQPARPDELEW